MTGMDLARLAGLIEGEGWFGSRSDNRPVIEMTMTDEDVIRWAHQTTRLGTVSRYTLPSGKIAWRWSINRIEDSAGLAMTLYSLLGRRRREAIGEMLARWHDAKVPRRLKTHCLVGHPLSGANLHQEIRNGKRKRGCRACRERRLREYRSRVAL